jgi:delta1-piperideine-2-carboxylate reductase
VSIAELATLVHQILVAAGMSDENARIVGGVVVAAERDGSRSHGIFRVPSMVEILRSGWVDGFATPAVVDRSTGLVLADGYNGFAQVAYAAAQGLLIEKARRHGLATLGIRNAHHFCALWPDVEPLAERGLVAIAFVNSRSYVVPAGGCTRLYGTNPMAFACPRRDGHLLAWDQASSAMAHGEVLLARRGGRSLPSGVGLDSQGRPTTDPAAVLEGGALLPFGGYKGSSIALMVELLAAAVTGGDFGFENDGNPNAATKNAGELVIAIDPAQSAGAPFLDRVEEVFRRIAENGKARLPGDRRYAERRRAVAEGITLERSVYEGLVALNS